MEKETIIGMSMVPVYRGKVCSKDGFPLSWRAQILNFWSKGVDSCLLRPYYAVGTAYV